MINQFSYCKTVEDLDLALKVTNNDLDIKYYIENTISKDEFDSISRKMWDDYYKRKYKMKSKELFGRDSIMLKSDNGSIWKITVTNKGELSIIGVK